MKKLLSALVLVSVFLTGCVSNSYLSVTPHSSARAESTDAITVENYHELRSALVQQVDLHTTRFSMITYSYAGDVEADLANAVDYVCHSYPIGAYAVQDLEYDLAQVASYYQIEVSLTYSRSIWELEKIQEIRMENLDDAISAALGASDGQQVLMISAYRDTDFAAYCADYAARNPETVMQTPAVTYSVWPDSGSVRSVELHYAYADTRYTLQQMRSQVDEILSAADVYVGYGRTQAETVELLHSFLAERFVYQPGTTDTPAYSMLCEGISDSQTYAEIFRILCQRAGITCYAVDGLKNGQLYKWNILELDGRFYHADPYAAELAGLVQLPLYTDAEMTAYVWDQSAYPACTAEQTTEE